MIWLMACRLIVPQLYQDICKPLRFIRTKRIIYVKAFVVQIGDGVISETHVDDYSSVNKNPVFLLALKNMFKVCWEYQNLM